jgi:hypothetical protein
VFDNIALSMTDQLQEGKTRILAHGLTSQSIEYIRIRWVWLALPLAVEVAGCVQLIATIIGSRRSNMVVSWKASSTALLYHKIDANGVMRSDVKGPQELQALVSNVRARLE